MSDNADRQEAEARLAAAQEQLRAAEAAYRQVVPCEHRTMTITAHPEGFHCADCGTELPDPRGCQHHRIDNDTECCVACGERMLEPIRKPVTVLSAPNKAACANPECSGDVDDPRCGNPHGVYVPDHAQEREVVIRIDVTYRCQRCCYDGMVFSSGNEPIWDCGHDHRGDSIPIQEEATA